MARKKKAVKDASVATKTTRRRKKSVQTVAGTDDATFTGATKTRKTTGKRGYNRKTNDSAVVTSGTVSTPIAASSFTIADIKQRDARIMQLESALYRQSEEIKELRHRHI